MILQLYRSQLVDLAGLKYVRTFEMVNEGNRTEYVLFFGTNSSEGLSKMKQAMWKADSWLTVRDIRERMDYATVAYTTVARVTEILHQRVCLSAISMSDQGSRARWLGGTGAKGASAR